MLGHCLADTSAKWALYGGWDAGWRYKTVQFLISQGAAVGGKTGLMRVLLEFDANPNVTNPEGETPLHSVARFRGADCALVLLEHGADLNAASRNGRTPLTTAIIYNNREVLQLFIDRYYEFITASRLQGMFLYYYCPSSFY